MTELSGSCLCGEVSFIATSKPVVAGHCHCIDCRKASGTGHGTHVGIPEPAFSLTGEVKFFEKAADSGNNVRRGFCPTCGCAIYSTNSGVDGMVFIRASSLDDPEQIEPEMVVYTSRAPSWDVMDPNLPSFTEMPEGGAESVLQDTGE